MRVVGIQFDLFGTPLSSHPEVGAHIANLDGSEEIQSAHLAEALHLRQIKVNHGKADSKLMFHMSRSYWRFKFLPLKP